MKRRDEDRMRELVALLYDPARRDELGAQAPADIVALADELAYLEVEAAKEAAIRRQLDREAALARPGARWLQAQEPEDLERRLVDEMPWFGGAGGREERSEAPGSPRAPRSTAGQAGQPASTDWDAFRESTLAGKAAGRKPMPRHERQIPGTGPADNPRRGDDALYAGPDGAGDVDGGPLGAMRRDGLTFGG